MMSQNIKSFLLTCLTILISTISIAQCGISTNQGAITPTVATQNTSTISSGKPYWQFAATAGCEYTFTTCGNSTLDTYLRLYEDGSWTLVALNDDICGTRSTITWTAPSSMTYNILLTSWSCNNLSGSGAFITYSTNCGAATCSDGIQNQGETGIDCGGPCPACAAPTCSDGIQNQGELGIDCGGPCTACVGNTCSALGFDDVASTFTGSHSVWTIYKGKNDVDNSFIVDPTISTDVINDSRFDSYADLRPGSNPHGSSFDYWNSAGMLIPVPNGSTNVIRLGAYQDIGSEAHGMIGTFTVTDSYLKFYYILGFEETGGSHTTNEKGFCTFNVKDASNNLLPCSFSVYENDPSETWTNDNSNGGNWVYLMSSWNSVTIDVSSYIGQSLTIEVWTADCTEGAHSGYGYFDFECLSSVASSCNTVLPVDVIEFEAACIDNKQTLDWITVSETNNNYFTISKSFDGVNFNETGKVYGAGNSNTQNQYRWVDDANNNGLVYYKLSQTDFDGAQEVLGMEVLRNCELNAINAYVNQNNNIVIQGEDIYDVTIFNTIGQIITNTNKLLKGGEIRIPSLSNGIYIVSIKSNSGERKNFKVVVR